MQPPLTSGMALTVPVDVPSEQLIPSDAEVVPLGLPQPAELSERSVCPLPPSGLDGCQGMPP